MAKIYKVFKYDSRNTGLYIARDISLKDARDVAIRLSKTKYPKANIEAGAGQFEQYENGEKTAWSYPNGL